MNKLKILKTVFKTLYVIAFFLPIVMFFIFYKDTNLRGAELFFQGSWRIFLSYIPFFLMYFTLLFYRHYSKGGTKN